MSARKWVKRKVAGIDEHRLTIPLTPPREVCLGVALGKPYIGRLGKMVRPFAFYGYVDHGDGGHDYLLEGERHSLTDAKRAAEKELRDFCVECLAALDGEAGAE